MNSPHERRITCAGLNGGSLRALEGEAQILLVGSELGALQPGHVVLHVAPDPLERVPLGAIRGQEEQTYVPRESELRGGVRPTVVQHEQLAAVGEGLREALAAELGPLGVPLRPLSEEPGTRRRLHGASDRAPRTGLRDRAHRLHPTRGEAPAADREAAEAAVVLAEHADRAGIRGWDDRRQAIPARRLDR
jgi:hypothetical protein